jgi:hypothetical protein
LIRNDVIRNTWKHKKKEKIYEPTWTGFTDRFLSNLGPTYLSIAPCYELKFHGILEGERIFSHLRSIQTDSEFYKASYSSVTGRFPDGGKVAEV